MSKRLWGTCLHLLFLSSTQSQIAKKWSIRNVRNLKVIILLGAWRVKNALRSIWVKRCNHSSNLKTLSEWFCYCYGINFLELVSLCQLKLFFTLKSLALEDNLIFLSLRSLTKLDQTKLLRETDLMNVSRIFIVDLFMSNLHLSIEDLKKDINKS